ncbi:sterol glucosyltransferase [Fusarium agapanthi]|uniref:Sterol glucosyltransferase n=1 Tax=Fusarium agapanthi TaxID=1803897 RepID=A0A9P5B6N9_9HYPO|nr:sterol glucosyltransferase [Fusarium agapanthi]
MSKSRSRSPSKGKESQDADSVLDIPRDASPPTSRVNDHAGVDIQFSSLQPDEVNRLLPPDKAQDVEPTSSIPAAAPSGPCPALNVVIQVVGSRGDVPPFIALGVAFQRYGHRMRLATYDTFTDFVRSSGLEFYPIGGDPEDCMAYMVKNPGLIPSMESLRGGDIGRKRVMIDMLRGFWSSCVKPDLAATRSFPHPLANSQSQNMDPRASNYLSYGVVDLMAWQGLGDVINAWRVTDLHLDPLAAAVSPDIVGLIKVPYTYCWSPALVLKPSNWRESINKAFTSVVSLCRTNHPTHLPKILQTFYTNSVFYLGNCPHEWLFKRVAAVVHHGGASTTAYGLVNSRPTNIVPFLGDPEAQAAANRIATQMRQESGVNTAVNSFHRHLPIANLTCDLIPHNAAKWEYVGKSKKGSKDHVIVSNAALKVLLDSKKAKLADFEPLRPKEYLVENERWDPLTAGASSVLGTMTDFTSALGGAFIDPFKDVKRVRTDGTATAVASGKALQGMTTAVVKGSLVDVLLALAEGLRNTPRLYGEKVHDHGPVTDWKSGSTVAAKNFGVGFYEGITDIVTKPMKGAKEEGALGFFKGVGKGSLNMVAKPGSAMFGLLAYPAQGVYKSVQSMKTNKARESVAAGRVESLADGEQALMPSDAGQVVRRFQELTG